MTAAAGDLADCKAYHREAPTDNVTMNKMLTQTADLGEIEQTFMVMAGNLESDTSTAKGPALVTALGGTVAGMRQVQAIVNAWTDDSSLDMFPGVETTAKASTKVAQICSTLDPTAAYVPITDIAP